MTAKEVSVDHIVLIGNNAYTAQELLNVAGLKEKKSYDSDKLKNKVDLIQEFYQKNGYEIAKVFTTLDLDNNLYIIVSEGIIKEVIFLNLNFIEVFSYRAKFGFYKDQVFYKPFFEEKLKSISKNKKFHYEFIPVKNKRGVFYLFLSKNKQSKNRKGKKSASTDITINFRGWALSLVPYLTVKFKNFWGYDHSLKLKADVRLDTPQWADLKFRGSVVNEYYTLDYFSPRFYNSLRVNFYTAIRINRDGRDDLGVDYKTIRFPFQLGLGLDLKNIQTALRGGFLYEKLRQIEYDENTLVDPSNPSAYPEFFASKDFEYTYFSWRFVYTEKRKYIKERDNTVEIDLDYQFNSTYKWLSFRFQTENFFEFDDNVILLRYRTLYMNGDFPAYYQFVLQDEFHLRGYGTLGTDRAMDATFEIWNSLKGDFIHLIWAMDIGWFHNMTYDEEIETGNFALSYGVGISFSYKETTFRLYYNIPIKQRADRGRIDFFFRRRF